MFDRVLDVLTFRVGRGIAIETGGSLVGDGAVNRGNARSDPSDPSRKMVGSG